MLFNQRTLAVLAAGILALMAAHPTLADSLGNCAGGGAVKDESAPYSLKGYYSAAYFKAGVPCYGPFTENTVVAVQGIDCFWVEVSDSSIKVTQVGPGPTCKGISHLEGVAGTPPAPPTPAPTPTPAPNPPPFETPG